MFVGEHVERGCVLRFTQRLSRPLPTAEEGGQAGRAVELLKERTPNKHNQHACAVCCLATSSPQYNISLQSSSVVQ